MPKPTPRPDAYTILSNLNMYTNRQTDIEIDHF